MSGGQQQRVAIARALVHDPPLVVADEPTAHLDHIQVEGVLVLVRKLAAPGRLVLVSTHDDRITQIADRVIELVPHFSGADRGPEEVRLEPGEVLFKMADRGELVYVVEEGDVEIFRTRADGAEEFVATIAPGNYFGELGPMFNLPRSASARSRTGCRLTAYPIRAFRRAYPAMSGPAATADPLDSVLRGQGPAVSAPPSTSPDVPRTVRVGDAAPRSRAALRGGMRLSSPPSEGESVSSSPTSLPAPCRRRRARRSPRWPMRRCRRVRPEATTADPGGWAAGSEHRSRR